MRVFRPERFTSSNPPPEELGDYVRPVDSMRAIQLPPERLPRFCVVCERTGIYCECVEGVSDAKQK